MNDLRLPWPPRELSPNARTHWRAKAPISKRYKAACLALARAAGMVAPSVPENAPKRCYSLFLDFYPPDRRARDDDNIIASFKAGRDGLAQALGVDDKRFVCHPRVMEQTGGFVQVRIGVEPVEG